MTLTFLLIIGVAICYLIYEKSLPSSPQPSLAIDSVVEIIYNIYSGNSAEDARLAISIGNYEPGVLYEMYNNCNTAYSDNLCTIFAKPGFYIVGNRREIEIGEKGKIIFDKTKF